MNLAQLIDTEWVQRRFERRDFQAPQLPSAPPAAPPAANAVRRGTDGRTGLRRQGTIAYDCLVALSQVQDGGLSAAQISDRTGIEVKTVAAIVQTLFVLGEVERVSERRPMTYAITAKGRDRI